MATVIRDPAGRDVLDEFLRQTEQRVFVESIKDYAIFMLDPAGMIKTWNRGAEAIKGYRSDEVIGKHVSLFYTPQDVDSGKPQKLLALATKDGRVEDEGWRVRKDGSRFWADVVITAVKRDGELVGYAKVTRDLTTRKIAADDQRRNEDSLSATLYSIGDGVIATDQYSRITRMNPVAERLTGWEQREALGQPIGAIFNIINEVTRRPVMNPVQRVLAEGVVVGLANHTALISRDGSERPIADSGAPIRGPDGATLGAVMVFRDITDERRGQEALRQSEEKLRLMIASVQDYAIFMLDAVGYVSSWNPGAERIKGYRAEEIIGTHFSRFYPAADVEAGKPARELELAAAHGRLEDEGWRVRKDGSQFWANVVINAMRDDSGRLVGFTKVTRDMTERKRTEEELSCRAMQQAAVAELSIYALRARELQPILDRAVEVVAKTLETEVTEILELQSGDGSLLLRAGIGWHDALIGRATVSAGRDSQEGFALLSGEPVVVEDLASETRFSAPLLRQHGVVGGMSVVIPLQGEQRAYGVLGAHSTKRTPFAGEAPAFLQAVANVVATAIARTRTEELLRGSERNAEEERQRAVLAQEAVRERDVFLSVAAHEFRTPLTALQLKLQGLERIIRKELAGTALLSKAETRFQDALRQTDRLSELVERLLDVSRIATGRLEMLRADVELESLVRNVINDFREKAIAARTEIRMSVSGDSRGSWDRGRLEQVLVNLLSNAVKYGEGKRVDVAVEGGDSEVRLTVADRGIGIAQGDVERIFNPFERAAPVEHFAGLGLGLYITKHIVQAHGGRIELSSKPNEGAKFMVVLPRQSSHLHRLPRGASRTTE